MNENVDFFYCIFISSLLYIFIWTRTKGWQNKDWNCNQLGSNHLTTIRKFKYQQFIQITDDIV